MLDLSRRHALAGACLFVGLAGATSAEAAPHVTGVSLDRGAVTGREVKLRVRAVDPQAPVSGLIVTFGRPSETIGSSACRPPDSRGRAPGRPYTAGAPVTLQEHRTFRGTRPVRVLARVNSGGCSTGGGSIFQPVVVTPTRPGQPTKPLAVGAPAEDPSLLPKTFVPGGITPPGVTPPGLPPLVAASRAVAFAAAATKCKNARRVVGRSRRSRRVARRALFCLHNEYRRHRGLPRLRENRRLINAAGAHSRLMVRRRFFSHVEPGRVDLKARLTRAHYLPARTWVIGENIAYRRGSPLGVFRGWLGSPPHLRNIVEGRFREIGIGIAAGTPGVLRRSGSTFTVNFARKG